MQPAIAHSTLKEQKSMFLLLAHQCVGVLWMRGSGLFALQLSAVKGFRLYGSDAVCPKVLCFGFWEPLHIPGPQEHVQQCKRHNNKPTPPSKDRFEREIRATVKREGVSIITSSSSSLFSFSSASCL